MGAGEGGGYSGQDEGRQKYLHVFCVFLGLSIVESHLYPLAVRLELRLPHRKKWDAEDRPQLLFPGLWNWDKSQGLYIGVQGKVQKQTHKAMRDSWAWGPANAADSADGTQ